MFYPLWILLLKLNFSAPSPSVVNDKKLVWISLDGFMHKYLKNYSSELPFLNSLRKNGSSSQYLTPSYYTKTFPNHMTQVTGLHEEEHGVVGNNMYNKSTGKKFSDDFQNSEWWDYYGNNTPIWITNQLYQRGKSALIHWPGSISQYNHSRADYYIANYTEQEARVRLGFAKDILVQKMYNLLMVYVNDVDFQGHRYGPYSDALKKIIKKVDLALEEFYLYLKTLPDKYYLIISSDHGMSDMTNVRLLYLSDYISNLSDLVITSTGPSMMIYVKKTSNFAAELIYKNLSSVAHIDVYLKNEVPEELKYRSHPHISDIIIISKPRYCILPDRKYSNRSCQFGNHGYLPEEESSRGIFILSGPDVRSNYVSGPLGAHELYSIACRVLNLKICRNTHKWSRYDSFFVQKHPLKKMVMKLSETSHSSTLFVIIILAIVTVTVTVKWIFNYSITDFPQLFSRRNQTIYTRLL